MKKITNLLIVCSLALAGAVMAQEPTPEESQSPGKKADKKAPAEVKPKAPPAPKTEAPAVAPKPEKKAPDVPKSEAPAVQKPEKKAPEAPKPMPPETKPQDPATSATTPAPKTEQPSKKDMKKAPAPDTSASASSPAAEKTTPPPATAKTTPAASVAPKAATTPAAATTSPAAAASTTPAASTAASTTPAAATTSATPAAATASVAPAAVSQITPTKPADPTAVKKPDSSKIEQIRQKTATFRAQPRLDIAPAVTFTPNYRIQGAEQWQGPQYEVYRTYRPERHDQAYYTSRYQRVELIAGGYYYFHNNYWYPAWGYSPREEYYAYDAPIYAGKRALPPDKVIAEVQAVLKEMGYYKGEVDGLLGPLTRAALMGYQTDNGMAVTAVIDEPTLESLGMG